MRKFFLLALALGLLGLSIPATVSAQESNVIVNGLNNPRGLFYDQNGVLWIAEAGTGGDQVGQGSLGPIKYGGTSQIVKVAAGKTEVTPVLGGLPSAPNFDDMIGANSVYVDADGLWFVTGIGPLADPLVEAAIQLDPKSLRIKQFIDLYAYESENNPDADVVMSDPIDITVGDDGTYYFLDASGNDLLTWTSADGLKLFHAWTDLPVPTAVDVGPNGHIYVSFLSPFPYDAGTARIEEWSADGTLVNTFGNLTAVTDVAIGDDGTVYAVQLADGYGDLGFNPNTGSVIKVTADGKTPIAEGLNYPYRMAIAPNGGIAVTINSTFSPADSGAVIAISGEIPTMSADQLGTPVSTPEVTDAGS
jgi:hypothetical protein